MQSVDLSREALARTVAAVYAVFDRPRVPPGLAVCTCPACMSKAMRAEIVATPVRSLRPEAIREYSNSAHGVPPDPGDLKALLPRYLDLIAQGIAVDTLEIGCDLVRFGEASRQDPALWSRAERAALDDWGRALIAAAARPEARLRPLGYCTEMLIAGGWPAVDLLSWVDAAFAEPDGHRALARFAAELAPRLRYRRGGVALDWYALGYARPSDRAALATWLNGDRFAERLAECTQQALPQAERLALDRLFDAVGAFDWACFPDHSTR